MFPSGFTPPDPQASSIVVGWRPWIFNFNFTATRVFTSFAALTCCKSSPPARYRIAARAPPCGSTHKALPDSRAKSLRGRLIKEELLYEAFDPQAFDVLEMPAIIGEESEIVLAGGDADNKIEVGDTLSLRA